MIALKLIEDAWYFNRSIKHEFTLHSSLYFVLETLFFEIIFKQ